MMICGQANPYYTAEFPGKLKIIDWVVMLSYVTVIMKARINFISTGGYGGDNNTWCAVDSIIEGNYNWNHFERAVFNIHLGTPQDYCDIEMPLFLHYAQYYNMYGNTTPVPWLNVPLTFTRLTSVPNDPQLPSSWRTIPSGAISEYAAHIVPCPSCDSRSEAPFATTSSASATDTLAEPKSLQQSASFADDATPKVYPNPADRHD